MDSNQKAVDLGPSTPRRPSSVRCRSISSRSTRRRTPILIDGNTASALGCLYAGATVGLVSDHAVDVADGCLPPLMTADPETRKNRYAILQAEDELAAVGMVIGASWAGARALHPPRVRHLADERVHRPRLLRRSAGGDFRRAARGSIDRDADADAAGRSDDGRLRVARRHAPHLPLSGRPARGVRAGGEGVRRARSGSRRRCSC